MSNKKIYTQAHLVVILHDLGLDLGRVDPSHKVLSVPSHEVRRISNSLWPHTNVSLLNVNSCLTNALGHFLADHDNGQSATVTM